MCIRRNGISSDLNLSGPRSGIRVKQGAVRSFASTVHSMSVRTSRGLYVLENVPVETAVTATNDLTICWVPRCLVINPVTQQ